jgi:hypothetical protein
MATHLGGACQAPFCVRHASGALIHHRTPMLQKKHGPSSVNDEGHASLPSLTGNLSLGGQIFPEHLVQRDLRFANGRDLCLLYSCISIFDSPDWQMVGLFHFPALTDPEAGPREILLAVPLLEDDGFSTISSA